MTKNDKKSRGRQQEWRLECNSYDVVDPGAKNWLVMFRAADIWYYHYVVYVRTVGHSRLPPSPRCATLVFLDGHGILPKEENQSILN